MEAFGKNVAGLAATLVRADSYKESRDDEYDRGVLEIAASLVGLCRDEYWYVFAESVYHLRDQYRAKNLPLGSLPSTLDAGLTLSVLDIAEDLDVTASRSVNPEYQRGAMDFIRAYSGIKDREFLEIAISTYVELAQARQRAKEYAARLSAVTE